MCFAFRKSTSAEDQNLDDLLFKMAKHGAALRRQCSSPPSTSASVTSITSASDDCIMVEAPDKILSTASRSLDSGRHSRTTKHADGEEGDFSEYEDGENDESAASASVSIKRKRSGSVMVKGPAKKVNTTAVEHKRPEPSGKGEDYDDLRDRANKKIKHLHQDNNQLNTDLSNMQDERNEALLELSTLKKSAKIQEKTRATTLKASLQEMKLKLKADLETKHKAAMLVKDQRHKEDILTYKAKINDTLESKKLAEMRAKELKPEHSVVVQKKEKVITKLTDDNTTLGGVADKLRNQIGQLEKDGIALRKALANKSDDIIIFKDKIGKFESEIAKVKSVNSTHVLEMAGMKKSYAAERKLQGDKWQIQYDNAQESARRASDVRRSVYQLTAALNSNNEKRIDLEVKLQTAEAEIEMLKTDISKGVGNI